MGIGRMAGGNVYPMHTMVGKLRLKMGDDADNSTYIFTESRVGFQIPKGEGQERDDA